MRATAVKDFKATYGGRSIECEAGGQVEADAKTIEQLEAIGLVTTKQIRAPKPRKAASND